MASANSGTFNIGYRIPNSMKKGVYDSESSSNSDQDLQEKPEAPVVKNITPENSLHESRSTSIKKPKNAAKKEPNRDSSVSSVSSQVSTSSVTLKKNKRKKKKKTAVETESKVQISVNNVQVAKELSYVSFPLDKEYDFRLVCSSCFVQYKEGVINFTPKKLCPHCSMDQLAIKKKSSSHWILVRNRPDCGNEFYGIYKMCNDFKEGLRCKIKPCTFAHSEGEILLWTYEDEKKFSLELFILRLRKNNIVTSQMLADVKANNKYIPGLSLPRETSGTSSPSTKPMQSSESTIKQSFTNSSPVSIPGQKSYSKIHMIKNKPVVPPSSEPLPTTSDTVFVNPEVMNNPTIPQFEHSYSSRIKATPKPVQQNPALKDINVESWPFAKDENPLKQTYTFQMFCSKCFPVNFQKVSHHSDCLKNILAFAENGTSNWLQVRERKTIKSFNGNYFPCTSLSGEGSPCQKGNSCTYAHNTIEQCLWNADKQEQFDLAGFIYSHSSAKYKILDLVTKYGTSFSYICGACFKSSKEIIYENDIKLNMCSGSGCHYWPSNKILCYVPKKKLIRRVTQNVNFYKECFKGNCEQSTCPLAHSAVEREVWMLLRDLKIEEEFLYDTIKGFVSSDGTVDSKQLTLPPCPYKLKPLCLLCYSKGQKLMHKECGHSTITSGVLYVTIPGMKRIDKLPMKIPNNYYFAICRSLKNNKCQYSGKCTFAHSQEEIDIWQWMCFNKIQSLEDVVSLETKKSQQVVKGASSIVQTSAPAVQENPVPHYCQFCSISCSNKIEWENHCATQEHNTNVTYDQEQQWNYREPPWNCQKEIDLKLCEEHTKGQCLYSNVLNMYNLCPYAHGIDELDEWTKRLEWRALKTDMSKTPSIKSYILTLQDMYLTDSCPLRKVTENMPDIQIQIDGPSKVLSVNKRSKYKWVFTVTSTKQNLKTVSLLHDKDRLYFNLRRDGNNFQVLDGSQCKLEGKKNHWQVKVAFVADMYGSFNQRVVFDFNSKPLLFEDLSIDVGTLQDLVKLDTIRSKTKDVELWSPNNREIISLERLSKRFKKYKRPINVEEIITQDVLTKELNRNNYIQKMHKLLYMEELTCHQKMSRYNLCSDMIITETIEDEDLFLNSEHGTLFGYVALSEELSEDTEIGRMMITRSSTVYIALPSPDSKVYEVEIVSGNNQLKYHGYYRNNIYILLTHDCIKDFKLHPGTTQKINVQFQVNRHSFCLMHFALDNIDSVDIAFPDPVKFFSGNRKSVKCSSKVLNENQLVAVNHILSQQSSFLCPFILNGPYGTGKTETLAQATMELLDTQPNAKILICTQCNSSADLFILKHLNKYMEKKGKKNILLRLFYSGRFVFTVPKEVRQYTLMSPNKDYFANPEKKDFTHTRVVVVTLENCYQLIKLQMKGFFTHIFVDEAAQEFECKVLLPLSLATEGTCIVLAGDYHQMGIQVHSVEARQQGFGISILERLYKHYVNHPHHNINSDSPLHTLLVRNYRSVKEINQFISTCFYGITTNPKQENILPPVSGLKPLQFYAVSGLESHSSNSTSYYNELEVKQIVDCVNNISSNWPRDLGPFDPKDICIVSCYSDQVSLIRRCLRKKSSILSGILVEKVGNIPGKEFKVIIISTVRTSHYLDITSEKFEAYFDETEAADFFSNKKLLNTTMTRAKYSVVTVGDPVALCAYGKCATIWRTFLNHCSKLCSVKPWTMTYNVIRHEVNKLLSSKEITPTQQFPLEHQNRPVTNPANDWQVMHNLDGANNWGGAHNWEGANNWGVAPNWEGANNWGVAPNWEGANNWGVAPNWEGANNWGVAPNWEGANNWGVAPNWEGANNWGVAPNWEGANNWGVAYNWAGAPTSKNPPFRIPNSRVIDKYHTPKHPPNQTNSADAVTKNVSSSKAVKLNSNKLDSTKNVSLSKTTHSESPQQNAKMNDPQNNPKPKKDSTDPVSKNATSNLNHIDQDMVKDDRPKKVSSSSKTVSLDLNKGSSMNNPKSKIDLENAGTKKLSSSRTASSGNTHQNQNSNPPTNATASKNVQLKNIEQNQLKTNSQVNESSSKSAISSKTASLQNIKQSPIKIDPLKNTKFETNSGDANLKNTPESVNLEIVQLGWDGHFPLNYSMSQMNSLFSFSKTKSSSEHVRINFSFPSVFVIEAPFEKFTIGISIYKVGQNFVIGIHWPDLQNFIPKKNPDDNNSLETVFMLDSKCQLPNLPELYFTLAHTISAMSCLVQVDREGIITDCSFHQTLIKPQEIIPIEEFEKYLQRNTNKEELNFPNYLQKLVNVWCKLRLGNESLHSENPFTVYPKTNKLLTEILIQVHIQIVRFLMKVFPETTPTAKLSFKEGPALEQWKREHLSDALNSVSLLQPYLQGKLCQCKVFCKCLLVYIRQEKLKSNIPQTLEVNLDTWQQIVNSVNDKKFQDAQDFILNPLYHNRTAVALKKMSDLTHLEFRCSPEDPSNYNLTFNPHVYFCKPSINFLDLLVQKMLAAAIHNLPNPVTVKEIQEVTKKLTKTIAAKQLQQKERFWWGLRKEFADQVIKTPATVVSLTNSTVEIMLPQIGVESYTINLDVLGSKSSQSDICRLQFTQIEADIPNYSRSHPLGSLQKKIVSSQPSICIEIYHWQRILSCLLCQDFFKLKDCIQSISNSDVMKEEQNHPDCNTNTEVNYCIDVHPYLNLQTSVKIVEDPVGNCRPQLVLLHMAPNISLCLLHHDNPLKFFFPKCYTALSEYQHKLLTEVYHLALGEHRSIVLQNVTLVPENHFWTFTIPSEFLENHNIVLSPDIDTDKDFLYAPLQNMVCIEFLLTLDSKSRQIFHGYICNTVNSGSNVKVIVSIMDDVQSKLVKLQNQTCNVKIFCWQLIHRCMADSILNLEAASPLAKNIFRRQLNPVKCSSVVSSVFAENEFALILTKNVHLGLGHLMHWFEDYASTLLIRKKAALRSPVLICTPNKHELDTIQGCLESEKLISKINVVRVAEKSESQLFCTSSSKIYLHEKLTLCKKQFTEEMEAFAEIYGRPFNQEDFRETDTTDILSNADVILCTCLTAHSSFIRSVSSYIKQMIIFNSNLCSELEAIIPLSYLQIERLGLISSSEPSTETSIMHRILQSCPQTKVIFP